MTKPPEGTTRITLWVDDEPNESSPDLHTVRIRDGRALIRITENVLKQLIEDSDPE